MSTPPWQDLGTDIKGKTGTAALKAARLDWRVTKHPMFTMMGHEKVVVPARVVLMRDSRPLTVVSPEWEPTQNADAVKTFEAFAAHGNMTVEYLGSAKRDRVIWGLIKTGWGFDLSAQYMAYALLSNPHEYGKSMDARYLLMNRDTMATIVLLLENGSLMPTHRSRPDATAFGLILRELRETHAWMEGTARRLSEEPHRETHQYFETVFKSPRPAETAAELLAGSTWWDAVMSVAVATDHKLGFTPDTRLSSAWYGVNRMKKQRAISIAREKCENAKV